MDLDGTLVTIDSLHETVIGCLRLEPAGLREIAGGLRRGKAAFKAEVCGRAPFDPSLLPYNQELIAYLREQKRLGRTIGLFTAADQSIAGAVARHLGLFSAVRASDGVTNLGGGRKLEAIRAAFGERFAYAGDHASVDRPIFAAAEQVVLVGAVARLRQGLPPGKPVEAEFPVPRAGFATWAHALRMRTLDQEPLGVRGAGPGPPFLRRFAHAGAAPLRAVRDGGVGNLPGERSPRPRCRPPAPQQMREAAGVRCYPGA